jgi:hypothetical protein
VCSVVLGMDERKNKGAKRTAKKQDGASKVRPAEDLSDDEVKRIMDALTDKKPARVPKS